MEAQIKPGATIVVIRSADGEPLREQAQVASANGERVTVSLQHAHDWNRSEPAVLVRTEAGAMWAAPALCESQAGSSATFQILRDWSPTNRRKSPRFETRLFASVRNGPDGPLSSGKLLDISDSGARVVMDCPPAGGGVDLVITALNHQIEIPCRVVDSVASGGTFEVRLSFRCVFAQDQRFLASLLDLMGSLQRQGRNLLVR
jgi:hypothetical protein